MSFAAAQQVLDGLRVKKDGLLCTATGGSPLGLYKILTEEFSISPALFDKIRIATI